MSDNQNNETDAIPVKNHTSIFSRSGCLVITLLRKMTLKTLIFLFVFSLGFILSELRFTGQTDQVDNSHQSVEVYVYDTEQKIKDFYQILERQFSEMRGLPPESPEVKEYMAEMQEVFGRPLVAVEAFAIFVNNDGDKFTVHDNLLKGNALLLPLVELKVSEQSKRLRLSSLQEKGCSLPRFMAQFTYSEDGTYEKGSFQVHEEYGKLVRFYFDTQGIGFFNTMAVLEDGILNTYHLNDLTWEKADNGKPEQDE